MKRRKDISVWGLTVKLVLVCWLCWSILSMAMLGSLHTAAVWCGKYSVPTNPACRAVEFLLTMDGH